MDTRKTRPRCNGRTGSSTILLIEEDGKIRVQPCVSPVWDTAIATIALADAKVPDYHPALLRAGRWLLEKEVRVAGDWQVRRRGVEPSGWHFFSLITSDILILTTRRWCSWRAQRTALAKSPEVKAATTRGVNWLMSMQNRDGGWAAFDVDIDNEVLTKVPFADR